MGQLRPDTETSLSGDNPNLGGGIPITLPDRSFRPIGPKPTNPIYRYDPQTLSDSVFYSPYGGGDYGPTGFGGMHIYGGKSDLTPSIAARSQATGILQRLLNRDSQGIAQQWNQAGANAARQMGGGLLSEAQQNMSPMYSRDMLLGDENIHRGLRDLLTQQYVQGGNLWGSAVANSGDVVQVANAKRQQQLSRIIGPFAGIPFVGGIAGGLGEIAR